MQPFEAWRAELEIALDDKRSELAEAEGDYEKQLFAVRAANNEKAAIAKAFAQLGSQQVAGALMQRRRGYETGLDAPASALTRATNAVAALRRQINDLETAIEQLHVIAPSPDDDTSDAAA
jgi:hypothetical protein